VFRAMAMKELRETRGIALVALAVYVYGVAAQLYPRLPFGDGREAVTPFLGDSFIGWLWVVSVPLAIALGLRQTLGESIPGTFPFLFHRPAGRRWLIGVKVLVGLGVYLGCASLPILAYGLWAATPGTHAGPFEWSATGECWIVWFGMTLLYLGAFLTGIRPGRWFGTRVLPLVGAALVMGVGIAVAFDLEATIGSLVVFLTADLWTLATILFVVETRDYP
jgi:hypothetical protein